MPRDRALDRGRARGDAGEEPRWSVASLLGQLVGGGEVVELGDEAQRGVTDALQIAGERLRPRPARPGSRGDGRRRPPPRRWGRASRAGRALPRRRSSRARRRGRRPSARRAAPRAGAYPASWMRFDLGRARRPGGQGRRVLDQHRAVAEDEVQRRPQIVAEDVPRVTLGWHESHDARRASPAPWRGMLRAASSCVETSAARCHRATPVALRHTHAGHGTGPRGPRRSPMRGWRGHAGHVSPVLTAAAR